MKVPLDRSGSARSSEAPPHPERLAEAWAVPGIGHGVEPLGETAPTSELVSTSISQQIDQDRIELYRSALRVKRPGTGNQNATPPNRSGLTLSGFSDKSRSRLRFLAENSSQPLISQFGLTYHDKWPTDGREAKRHLNAWLTSLRRLVPGVSYLWLLEFQKRNAPHFHVFLTVPPDEETRLKLAAAWCRLTSPNDPTALRFHQDQRNWIDWDMTSANYLCKYLDKEAQKSIPEGYINFGRFWGNSRDLKPDPDQVVPLEDLAAFDQVDHETGDIQEGQSVVIRWLGRLAEKQTRGYSRFRLRAGNGSYSMRRGSNAYRQIERYFRGLHKSVPISPPLLTGGRKIQPSLPCPLTLVSESIGSAGASR